MKNGDPNTPCGCTFDGKHVPARLCPAHRFTGMTDAQVAASVLKSWIAEQDEEERALWCSFAKIQTETHSQMDGIVTKSDLIRCAFLLTHKGEVPPEHGTEFVISLNANGDFFLRDVIDFTWFLRKSGS